MVDCPGCSNFTTEILVCDSCNALCCVRCIAKSSKQWVCNNCKSNVTKKPDNMFSMFG
ncbi:MAG: hypothetical protein HY361_03090 [Candidatus Aenigmarchaeota archaeon]|nr:hypothetical protein [Candidatus Aenigmarchaeota archaeon]